MTMWRSAIGGSSLASSRITCSARPVATATGMPPSDPLRVVSGVLKSGCASSHNMPIRSGSRVGPDRWRPATSPGIDGQVASSPTVKYPSRSFFETMSAKWPSDIPSRFQPPYSLSSSGGQLRFVDANRRADVGEDLLNSPLRHRRRALGGTVRRERLLGEGDAEGLGSGRDGDGHRAREQKETTEHLIARRFPASRLRQRERDERRVRFAADREHDVLLALVQERHRHRGGLRRDLHRADLLARGLVHRVELRLGRSARRRCGPCRRSRATWS